VGIAEGDAGCGVAALFWRAVGSAVLLVLLAKIAITIPSASITPASPAYNGHFERARQAGAAGIGAGIPSFLK
jgi:hypothetical protein